ncbi:hypothetical protein NP493_677g02077 [Ridgeia piscesae]|uniref:G-protein coupled receptors family 1 profile domain-containing protein n=1 Tax=Ridgeia piscesae TaxID=27915 RepID=A0AAD9KRH7_RIDPI|nr:hypothetical protein NP493_677g02077 [Ridgeia piscesae]
MANGTLLDDVCAGNASGDLLNLTDCDRTELVSQAVSRVRGVDPMNIIMVVVFGVICTVGIIGNGLVIFVVTRYTKMKTVTNMYILNLSIADGAFLLGLPLMMTTVLLGHWPFGSVMCKMYYMTTCINMFTGAYTLTVMSGDRFLAVCYPIVSMRYRTPRYALAAICIIWGVSCIVMLPVIMYARNVRQSHADTAAYSCVIQWPAERADVGQKTFMGYTLILGFLVPVMLISLLYTLLVVRLRTTGARRDDANKSKKKKVTRLVTLIIAVYIVCWLPYWAFQIHLIASGGIRVARWHVHMFQVFTLLSYANSMINPLLYAFTNQAFRESFISAFRCVPDLSGRRSSDEGHPKHASGHAGRHHLAVPPAYGNGDSQDMTSMSTCVRTSIECDGSAAIALTSLENLDD